MPDWSQGMINQLRTLVGEGLTGSQIGSIMRLTRNAIIGKANRIGLKLLTKPRLPRVRKPRSRTAVPRKRNMGVPHWRPELSWRTDADSLFVPLGVDFMSLTDNNCRYPLEETDPIGLTLYCGHQVIPKTSWCPTHYDMVFQPRRFRSCDDE